MFLDIVLGTKGEHKITYKLYENRVARRIWERFQETQFDYVSRTQFYNFGEDEAFVTEKLDEAIWHINNLTDENISNVDDLNMLHTNFPELVRDATGELRHWLSMFNYHIHHLEDIQRYQNKRFLFATQDEGEPLEQEDYALFSPTRLPGHLYMNYPHVGKHILELFYDNDVDIPTNHIVPTSKLKNDLVAWFGEVQYRDTKKIEKRVKRFCAKIAQRLPFDIDDPRLAIGHICLGELLHPVDEDMIAKHKYIHSIIAS
jgi:hypothetical protein